MVPGRAIRYCVRTVCTGSAVPLGFEQSWVALRQMLAIPPQRGYEEKGDARRTIGLPVHARLNVSIKSDDSKNQCHCGDRDERQRLPSERTCHTMLYKFKSKAAADLIMLEPHGRQILEIIGKTPGNNGIVTAAQIPGAISALEAAVAG